MPHRVCPWWLGYVLVSPLRRLVEPPGALLGGLVAPGMLVVEPGCGMGYFTLELARMVGPGGRIVAVDLQPRMLAGLRRRARRAGLAPRIDARLAAPGRLGLDDLAGSADLAVAIHVVHEVPEPRRLFAELARALRPEGRVLLVEPRGHVSPADVAAELDAAADAGLVLVEPPPARGRLAALLRRPAASG
jgi:SAM-dependent methyltransferase